MDSNVVMLTREELYELVWKEPTRKLAPNDGLSDVGLAKIWKKFKIPSPQSSGRILGKSRERQDGEEAEIAQP